MRKYFIKKFFIATCVIISNYVFSQDLTVENLNADKQIIFKSANCDKVYASGYSFGNNSIYELNGSTMTPVFTAPQNVGGLAISTNGKAYYDNGSFVSSPLFSSDLISQTNTGSIVSSMLVGEAADAIGNVYYIDSSGHLRKNVFGSIGVSSDLGEIIFDATDTIGPLLAYGDMAFDGNGRLYWYASVGGFSSSYLYTIDLNTLKASSLGNVGPDGATGLAFDATGKFITTSDLGSTVMSVDLSQPTFGGVVLGTANPSVFDLGSCATPLFNPVLSANKSVANSTTGLNPATVAQPGDILEYTIVIQNTGNLMANNSLFIDAIPSLTTYVPNTTTLNGISIADVSGNMPFSNQSLINSQGQLPGIVNVGSTVTIVFRVKVNDNALGIIPNTATVSFPVTNGGVTTNQTVNSNTVIVTIPSSVLTGDVIIYNHFTPNDDGANEFFFIEGIENFPNNTVEIYNRWGILVYEASGYNNNAVSFKGESSGRVTVRQKEQLPEGTYYYILKYTKSDGEVVKKASYLYINR